MFYILTAKLCIHRNTHSYWCTVYTIQMTTKPVLIILLSCLMYKSWLLEFLSSLSCPRRMLAFLLHYTETNQASWIMRADTQHSEDWILSESPAEQCEKLSWSTKQSGVLNIRAHSLTFFFFPPSSTASQPLATLCFSKACLSLSGLLRLWCLPSWYLVGTLASWIKSFQKKKKKAFLFLLPSSLPKPRSLSQPP